MSWKNPTNLFCALFLILPFQVLAQPVFRLHLNSEPASLSPFLQKNANAGYLLQNVFSPLLKIENGNLKPGLATCSYHNKKQIICEIKKEAKYQDGSPILAEDFARTFNAFMDPKTKALRADLLEPVAKVIAQKQKLTIELKREDSEFIYNLASSLLFPLKKIDFPSNDNFSQMDFSGPYKITKWQSKKIIRLEAPGRPTTEFLFVNEDAVALQMYEDGQLDFLRRLPTLFIPKYRSRKDFHLIPQFRFDYIGLTGSLKSRKDLRKALSESLNYQDFQALYFAEPRPGCPGLPDHLFTPDKPCLVSREVSPTPTEPLDFIYSRQGGDDHKRTAEWLQSEWKKKLGIQVNIQQLDNKIFLSRLDDRKMTLFRKGLAPERPTCLAVLENFLPESSENYLDIQDKNFQSLVSKMRQASASEKKTLCYKSISWLLQNYWLIPTGPISTALLSKEKWTGWHLNEMNQLDLSQLKTSSIH